MTFDGASVNRKIHQPEQKLLYKVQNPYASDGRDMLFFSDPPHLIKTTCNCWASKARCFLVCLANNNSEVEIILLLNIEQWEIYFVGYLNALYERDCLNCQLSLVPKLCYEWTKDM